ncbi:MAG: aspartyl protease family protein [Ignavibacteria bacterium]|nr:aspartyl protease family protein [Ignavibacteria bacterium]
MKKITLAIFFIIVSLNIFAQTSSVSVFLLKKSDTGLEIEKISIAENETEVFVCGESEGCITLILPVSAGTSGDFVKAGNKSVMIARFTEGKLKISVQKPDGTQKELLSKTPEELSRFDIKVNVISTDVKKVFKISGYEKAEADDSSPVIDMFQGNIPMNPGDYSITTEITDAEKSMKLEGVFDIRHHGGYYFTELVLNNSQKVNAVIDLAAAQSFLTRSAVPEGVNTFKTSSSMISADGSESVESSLSGFGGSLTGLEACSITESSLGSIKTGNWTYYVIDSLKTVDGVKIEAIIGLDILRNADFITMQIPAEQNGKCFLSSKSMLKEPEETIPFTLSQGHIFFKGLVNGTESSFLLDSGSPFCIFPMSTAKMFNVNTTTGKKIFGADGNEIKTETGSIENITIGSIGIKNIDCLFTDSPIFAKYGLESNGGLIGTSLLNMLQLLEIDLTSQVLRIK